MLLEKKRQKDLVLYSPTNCLEHSSKIKTIGDAINLKSRTLGQFKRLYGKDWVVGYISMWLINLNDQAHVKTKMSDSQIEFTAERIYEGYTLKITDLTLFFRNIKEGVYGPFFENLSCEKIMDWLGQYFNLRCEYAQMQSQSRHDNYSITKDKVHPKVLSEMFKGVGEEKIIHDKRGDGLGSRLKNNLNIKAIAKSKLMFENDLPEMSNEAHEEWLKSSFMIDGVRVGKPIK